MNVDSSIPSSFSRTNVRYQNVMLTSFYSGFIASAIDLITLNNFMIYAKNQLQLNRPFDRALISETLKFGYRGIGVHWLQFGSAAGITFALESKMRSVHRDYKHETIGSNVFYRCVSGVTVAGLWNTPMENIALKRQLTGDSTCSIVRSIVRGHSGQNIPSFFRGASPIIIRQSIVMPFLLLGGDVVNKWPNNVIALPILNVAIPFFFGGLGGLLSTPVDTIRVHMQSKNLTFLDVIKMPSINYFNGAKIRFIMIGYSSFIIHAVRLKLDIK